MVNWLIRLTCLFTPMSRCLQSVAMAAVLARHGCVMFYWTFILMGIKEVSKFWYHETLIKVHELLDSRAILSLQINSANTCSGSTLSVTATSDEDRCPSFISGSWHCYASKKPPANLTCRLKKGKNSRCCIRVILDTLFSVFIIPGAFLKRMYMNLKKYL